LEKLKVKITFKSGNIKEIESNDYYKGQFREWCVSNFIKNEFKRFDSIIWNNIYINIGEIEFIDEIQ
jgi:hypothetical protein